MDEAVAVQFVKMFWKYFGITDPLSVKPRTFLKSLGYEFIWKDIGNAAASILLHNDRKIIIINQKVKGNALYTCIYHELAHHIRGSVSALNGCELQYTSKDEEENICNLISYEFLTPNDLLFDFVKGKELNEDLINSGKKLFSKASTKLIVKRILDLNRLQGAYINIDLNTGKVRSFHKSAGFTYPVVGIDQFLGDSNKIISEVQYDRFDITSNVVESVYWLERNITGYANLRFNQIIIPNLHYKQISVLLVPYYKKIF